MRLTRSFEKHDLYPGNAGLTLVGRKGACSFRVEQYGISGGARYRVTVGRHGEIDSEGETATTKQAIAIVKKIARGC